MSRVEKPAEPAICKEFPYEGQTLEDGCGFWFESEVAVDGAIDEKETD
jgi:hypothetical protein